MTSFMHRQFWKSSHFRCGYDWVAQRRMSIDGDKSVSCYALAGCAISVFPLPAHVNMTATKPRACCQRVNQMCFTTPLLLSGKGQRWSDPSHVPVIARPLSPYRGPRPAASSLLKPTQPGQSWQLSFRQHCFVPLRDPNLAGPTTRTEPAATTTAEGRRPKTGNKRQCSVAWSRRAAPPPDARAPPPPAFPRLPRIPNPRVTIDTITTSLEAPEPPRLAPRTAL